MQISCMSRASLIIRRLMEPYADVNTVTRHPLLMHDP